ncbi:MAG TPA: glycerophosphodiester phosphodiesterase [Acidimicrobiales bacterium]|nr:glycerophosphodiester phosphodiesterase [Acidimicrobiales bacterium]
MTAIWAHRGGWGPTRENTLEAFAAARRLGAAGVELDVRCTADGVLVVHHDPVLDDGRVLAATPAADLPAWLPTLEDALEACQGLTVNVEVKSLPTEPGWDPDEPVATATARLVAALGRAATVWVSAFALPAVDAARAAADVATGWLTLPGYDQADALDLAARHGHRALHPPHGVVTPELVAAAHARGLAVHAWTADDPADVARLAAAGANAVITNDVAAALAALAPPH